MRKSVWRIAGVFSPAGAWLADVLPEGDGFVELAYNQNERRVLGGVAVGPHAADVLAPD